MIHYLKHIIFKILGCCSFSNALNKAKLQQCGNNLVPTICLTSSKNALS